MCLTELTSSAPLDKLQKKLFKKYKHTLDREKMGGKLLWYNFFTTLQVTMDPVDVEVKFLLILQIFERKPLLYDFTVENLDLYCICTPNSK